ncbi:XRE family transcriptional regulator [Streptomyces sp. NPDC059015]|uniref:XRE family transcriptional regulator n=1 Tax=unclassified Streptomyces TaxID=2593676 RepID=UPI0036C16D25
MTADDRGHALAEGRQLAELVARRKGELGLSYEALAARCIDPETGEQVVKYSWLHRLATGVQVKAPDVAMLRGMAAGLEVPARMVQDAAASQFFGLDAVYSPDLQVRTMVHHFEDLSPEDRRKILALIEAFRRA